MELMYPVVVVITIVLLVILFLWKPRQTKEYQSGKKVANTSYIKETDYYKEKMRQYKRLILLIKILSASCIILASVLVARIITVQTRSEDKFNRDIIISLDISTSECEVNLELVRKFKKIIPSIEGDRIGIVLYNTSPIVYCPLTDDYNYIEECLDTIEKQVKLVVDNDGDIPFSFDKEGMDIHTFWYGGVLYNADKKGSSLVGDGLAGTIFSFPDLKTNQDRTRIIIFATDNDVAGDEEVSLEEACALCKQYGINLYAYCPTVEMNQYTSEQKIASYKKAVEGKANGKFYTGNLDKMASSIVDEIKDTKTSLLKTTKKTYVTDHPEVSFVLLVFLFGVLMIVEKRAKI